MLLIQLTGLSGSGKSTLAQLVKVRLVDAGFNVEIIDGDLYREKICDDLTYSVQDRKKNIRRLGFIGHRFAANKVICILAAINPFSEIRDELLSYGEYVKLVWINCNLQELIRRDTKGLYRKALLPEFHPDRVRNFTGVSQVFQEPPNAHLTIDTFSNSLQDSQKILYNFIIDEIYKIT